MLESIIINIRQIMNISYYFIKLNRICIAKKTSVELLSPSQVNISKIVSAL